VNVDADSIQKKVRCDVCLKLTYFFEQDYATGEVTCEDCLEADDE
jgi:formylmethanofuran dehydrogenase subunit E